MEKQFIKGFMIKSFVLGIIVALTVVIVDPFFHYHKPLFLLKAVLDQPEYQCIGSIKNFEYDSIILGSSVAENYNNRMFDEAFGCTTIKGIQKSAGTKDMIYYLDKAYEDHDLKNVFYSLDLFAIKDDMMHVSGKDMPLYMFNNNPFDDVKYLLNKDVFFEKIPYMIAQSYSGYDEGLSYNWAQYKTFSEEGARANYTRPEPKDDKGITDEDRQIIHENLANITARIQKHPETNFYFIYPPYSKLWWEQITLEGELSVYQYITELSIETLKKYDNVKLFYFQNEKEITDNLDLYMDPIHFSDKINDWIVCQLLEDKYEIK